MKKSVVEKKDGKNEHWLGLLINWLILSEVDVIKEIGKWFSGVSIDDAEGKLLAYIFANPGLTKSDGFVSQLPEELKPMMEEILMSDDVGDLPSSKDMKKLAIKVLRETIERKIDVLNEQLKESEKNGESEKADQLYTEVVRLNKKSSEITALLA
jgi:hypothetical protein